MRAGTHGHVEPVAISFCLLMQNEEVIYTKFTLDKIFSIVNHANNPGNLCIYQGGGGTRCEQ